MKKFTQFFIILLSLLTLGAWNSEVLGADAWTSGSGSLQSNNKYYAFYNTSYGVTVKDGKSHVITLDAPCKSLAVNISRATAIASQSMSLWYSNSASGDSDWVKIGDCSDISKNGSNYSFDSSKIPVTARRVKFQEEGGLVHKYINSIKAEMADPFVTPSAESLDFGNSEVGSENSQAEFTFLWNNNATSNETLTITTDGANVSLSTTSVTATKGSFGTTSKVTVTYTHGEASSLSGKKIYIAGATTYATISLSGSTTRKEATMGWNDETDLMNPGDVFEDAAWSSDNTRSIKYTSSNEAAIKVNEDGDLEAVAAGSAKVRAYQEQDNTWAYVYVEKTITVTNKQKQTITWTDKLSYKHTDSNVTATMTATASSGLPIKYEVNSEAASWITISGSTITIKGKGTAYLTAKQVGNNDYVAVSVTRKLVSRDPNAGCTPLVLEQGEFSIGLGGSKELNITGFPYQLTFKAYKTMATAIGDLKIEQKINGSWSDVTSIGVGSLNKNSYKSFGAYTLNRNATAIRFTNEGSYTRYITDVEVTMASFLETSVSSLHYDAQAGARKTATFTVDYSNIQAPLSVTSSDETHIEVSPEEIGNDCGDYGTNAVVTVVLKAGSAGSITGKNITITDGKNLTKIIPVTATVSLNTQQITWNNEETFLTTDYVELIATSSSTLPITSYTSKNTDKAQIVNGRYMQFTHNGEANIEVYQEGNGSYESTKKTQKITINNATPDIATNPSGTAVTYLQNLSASTLSGGSADVTLRGVANSKVDGSWAWTNPSTRVEEAAGSHSYEVTFTPTDGGMYNNNTCQVAIQVNRAAQTLAMNDGNVKVAVEGLDANAPDSKLDLNTLIASQTADPVNANRVGAVTYEVISDNKANAAIADGNIFSATAIGDYTIRATKAETNYYNVATADFKVTVSKRANTMAIAGTEYEKFVDEEIADIRSLQNSDATVQTSSTSPTIAYYDVESNKILIPNSESDEQMFGAYKTVTIKIWQEATDRFEACEKTIILGVKKYVTTSNGEDYIIKVNETKTANYGFTNTSASYPSNNLTDDFYYTIDDPNFENAELNNGTELITYDPATNQITGHNAGTTKITFFQKETYKYTGATLMCNIAVEKRENQIANSWSNTWQKTMAENGSENISFTSTHGDYANYPISIEQIYGEDVAILTGDASGASITTNTTKGYAIWHLYQEENYEYGSAEADVMVMVGVPAPPTCYVYQDATEHKFTTSVWDAEGHFDAPIAINAPIDKIWYSARRQTAGVNYFVVQYSTDNEKTWSAVSSPDLGTSYGNYSATFPALSNGKRITHVRFGAKTGATLSKWYKDVRISRKAYLNIQDAEKKKISKLPTMTCTINENSSSEAKFYIDYSTCADEILIESSNPEYFTVSRSSIDVSDKHDNLTSAKEEITVTYHSTVLGTHNAVITVRTSYQTCALSVSGETTKRTPTLTWQEGYTNNPLTLPIGLTVNAIKPAATTTSTALIKYESNDESVVRILDNGYAFQVVGLGSALLTAKAPENEVWKEVSDTRVIHATQKVVQEIIWDQSFPRFMALDDVIDLDAKVFLRNLSTDALTYSEERSQEITYSCPLNNGIVSVSGNQMTILNYGEVKVTASVSGNADYEAAAPVIVLINVRQPSAGCATPFAFNKEDVIDMFEMDVDFSDYFNLTTEEMVSDEIALDPAQGKPDKLSFQYGGEVYKVPVVGTEFFGGFVKFEQRVNSQWLPVENSRVETVKNEWKTNSDLQLDERADALRIIREPGATGHHKIKDIQVTRKQYLRATQNEINLGEVTLGQATPVIVGFEYSDVKGDLTAHTINSTTDVTIKDNGIIDLQCGGFGHYNLQVTFTPTQLGEWQGAIEVYDNIANLSITVQLTANVTANEEYIFNHEGFWNNSSNWTTNLVPDENVDITVAKNMTISSAANVHSIAIENDVTVTVKSGATLVIGNGTPKSLESYGNLHVENGGNVILNDGASLILNDVILDAQLGITNEQTTSASCSGQITNESQLVVNGDAYFRLKLDPSGHNTLGWYDFVVPFPVDVIGGISIAEDPSAVMQFNVNYAVMNYDEAKNAQRGKHWNKFTGTMLPGRAYTITLDETKPWNTVVFKKKAGEAVTGDRSFTTEYSGLGATKDNGWNGFGNGTLHHTELDVVPGTLIQLYDHAHRCYQPREAKDYTISVGLSFFMQFDRVETVNLLAAEGNGTNFRAPERAISNVEKFRLALTAEDAINPADYIWVSASEEATDEYVIGRDVLKMGSMNESTVARMWTTRAGMGLCSNEMPLVDNIAQCALGLYAPQARTYTIAVEEAPQDANLYLTYNDQVIWDLTLGAYTIDLAKGKTTGYGLRIEARAPQIATGVENAAVDSKSARKVMINNTLYVVTPEGEMYDITGKFVK